MPQPHTESPLAPRYVEVALPLPIRRTFTYGLPVGFADRVKVGSRVLVPFGRQFLTGYAVALHEVKPDGLTVEVSAIKDAEELLDEEPLVTEEILRLTKWSAEYYAASWGEILKASLPAGINNATERIVSITEAGRNALLKVANFKPLKWQILRDISTIADRPQRDIEREYTKTAVQRAVRDLSTNELVRIRERTVTTKVKPKLRKSVRLAVDAHAAAEAAVNLGQSAVVAALDSASGEMLFSELSEVSGVSASAINTLAKKGIVDVSVREVRRDPLFDSSLPAVQNLT